MHQGLPPIPRRLRGWDLTLVALLSAPVILASDAESPLVSDPPRPDAFALRCGGPELYFADNIPGGYTARIGAQEVLLSAAGSLGQWERIAVLGYGRGGVTSAQWPGGNIVSSARSLWIQGERMAVHYAHSPQGLRQNFTVFEPPTGEGELSVQLELTGDHTATLEGSTGIRFSDPDGNPTFDYRDLRCWDATNTPLQARMRLSGLAGRQQLSILVNDVGATYPITVDPISTSPSTLLTGPLAGQGFGFSVCGAGDLNGDGRSDVAIGAPQTVIGGMNMVGCVYVHYGTNTGISTTPSLVLNGTQTGAQFGNSVSTAGDVNGDGYSDLVVGSRTWESNTSTELSEGAVFIFHGSATGLSTTPAITLQPNHADDNFGSFVACAGDINNDGYSDILVSAYLASYPTFNEGAVFVFTGSAAGINAVPLHRLERHQGAAFFGKGISSGGDINGDGFSDVVIGASKWVFTSGASDQGSAFVYYGSAAGFGAGANPAPALQLFGIGSNVAYFGWWTACAGDLNGDGYSEVAIAAYLEENGQTDEGRVYVYNGSATGLVTTPAAIIESDQAGSWTGRCVHTAGDMNGDGFADLAIGTPRWSNGQATEGRVQIHFGSPTGISTVPSVSLELNNAGANMGESLGPAGDVNGDGYTDLIVGAHLYGSSGAAAIFLGGPYSTNLTPTTSRFGGAANTLLGSSIANAGDVNGDGYADAIVGAPGASNGQAGEGVAYVHYGGASGLSAAPSVTLEANSAGAAFGSSVATAGDVNGDGYADVLVGAPFNGGGRAYIYLGSAGGLASSPVNNLASGSLFGHSVSTAGDVDHDGFSDVIIGAPGTGSAFVYRGSSAGLITTPYAILSQPPASGLFGCSVSTAGDVNGDGYSDVIVGARLASNGQTNEGAAYVYLGSATGVIAPYHRLLQADQANADFGVSVSAAGDVNGDGYFDVIVGADLWESGQTDEGGAFIFHGSPSGTSPTISTILQRNVIDGRMGSSVSEGGDVNGDGYADVVAGAPLAENPAGTVDEGIAYVFRGSATGIGVAAYDQLEPNIPGYRFGAAVSGGGDVDGDGYSDVLIGAPRANPAVPDEGGNYWFRGGSNRAINRLTRQYGADLVSPLSTNSTDFLSSTFFGIGHRARHPLHRCRARLRWEVVGEGQPFSNVPITNSVLQSGTGASWTTLPIGGVEIKQAIPKFPFYMRYKWRVRVEYDLAKLLDGQRFSRWFYGYASGFGDIGVLPIELLRFEGRAVGGTNELNWSTATEHMSARFDLLRSDSPSGFAQIASVPAAGESTSTLDYVHVDNHPPSDIAYYRLRMVDLDGGEELGPVIAISRANGPIGLFPNPADDEVQVIIGPDRKGCSILLLDAGGRVVRSAPVIDDLSSRILDIHDVAAGSYSVVLRDRSGTVLSAVPLIKR